MRRRAFVGAGLSLAGAALLPAQTARADAFSRVRPGQPGWPVTADWAKLGEAVGGRLAPVTMPDLTGPDAKALLGNPVPAVSCGAGAMWLHAYQAVSVGAGRYVQGGGCTTVGVAGLVQGGGGGTFGVVTRLTLATHELTQIQRAWPSALC